MAAFDLDRFSLAGRTAVVTGASRGIGREIALGLARAGADLVLASRTRSALEGAAEEIEALGRRALVCPTDVGVEEEVAELARKSMETFGRLHVLVNNAGMNEALVPTVDLSLSAWEKTIRVNLTGAFLCCREIGRRMAGDGGGSVVNLSSILGRVGMPWSLAYSVTKGGLMALTRSLAAEWARQGVRVNAVAPGFIETELIEAQAADPKMRQRLERRTLLGRLGAVDEVVGAVIYLASDASSYVTGTIQYIDGGWTAA